ncbi:MAG: hypothetical protein V2B19_02160 [Pseudomonadota bacterium]
MTLSAPVLLKDVSRTDGLVPTLEAVFKRLDEPLALGHCNVGTVVEARGSGGNGGWGTADFISGYGERDVGRLCRGSFRQ